MSLAPYCSQIMILKPPVGPNCRAEARSFGCCARRIIVMQKGRCQMTNLTMHRGFRRLLRRCAIPFIRHNVHDTLQPDPAPAPFHAVPTPPLHVCWQTAGLSPRRHAQALLEWLWKNGYGSAEFLAAEMQRIYAEVCRELNWAVRPWNPVARELTRLTTGRKVYRWVLRDGIRHRLRVYQVPTPDQGSIVALANRTCASNKNRLKAWQGAKRSSAAVDVARPLSRRRAHGCGV
jgi:hypothetical protein